LIPDLIAFHLSFLYAAIKELQDGQHFGSATMN